MSSFWKYALKSIGRTALAGLYGTCTVLFIKQALEYRERAFNSRDSDAAHAKMLELMNETANAEKATPKAGR